jgi:hypothetical protein
MRGRLLRFLVIGAFGVAVGHLAWGAFLGPPLVPDYLLTGGEPALTAPNPEAKNLYLRRQLFLSQRPRRAWLQVLARDELQVYVNGLSLPGLDNLAPAKFPTGAVLDLAPYLRTGPNVIALAAVQSNVGPPPAVAVEGIYVLDDGEHPLRPDEGWRCRTALERRGCWWFETDFDDRHWEVARLADCPMSAKVKFPPRAVTAAGTARWITPPGPWDGRAGLRREFDIPGRPRQAWLRLTATAPYRLAVNGVVFDQREAELGTDRAVRPVQRTYDLTTLLRRGPNVVSLLFNGLPGPPHLRADLEVEDHEGRRLQLGTNERWLGSSGGSPDWFAPVVDDSSWQPCAADAGDLGVPPWLPGREQVEVSLPFSTTLGRAAEQAGWIIGFALLTALVCRWAARRLAFRPAGAGQPVPAQGVYLALVLPAVAVSAAVYATFDPRVARQDVYRVGWVLLAVAAVPLQWGLLWLLGRCRRGNSGRAALVRGPRRLLPAGWAGGLVLGLAAAGGLLRASGIPAQPLQHDEAMHYRAALGVLERGLPSIRVNEDLPVQYVPTSELMFYGMAAVALVSDDPVYVVRVPAVVWGTLTVGLIYLVGRRLFATPVGLVAAAVYAFSPVCVEMAGFGRYYSQLQFFALLTVYLYWQTLRGPGPIDRRALWLTTASFIAMYLSWEAAALLVPGMLLAGFVARRGRLRTIFGSLAVWAALLLVLAVVVIQLSFRDLYLTQLLYYGTHAADVDFILMWPYPFFQPLGNVRAAGWSWYALIPLAGLAGAGVIALRHAFRRPARFLILIFLPTCLLLDTIMPVWWWRYSYYLSALLILLSAAALVAGFRGLIKLARQGGAPGPWRAYARGVAVVGAVALTVAGGGWAVQPVGLAEPDRFTSVLAVPDVSGPAALKFPNVTAGVEYLRGRLQEGDVVIAGTTQVCDLLLGRPADYWLFTLPGVVAVIDDRSFVPRNRYTGTAVLADLESLEDVFARHQRIWYLTVPWQHEKANSPRVSAFLREHMDVAYEDFTVLVMFRDRNHRPASLRRQNEQSLEQSGRNFLR